MDTSIPEHLNSYSSACRYFQSSRFHILEVFAESLLLGRFSLVKHFLLLVFRSHPVMFRSYSGLHSVFTPGGFGKPHGIKKYIEDNIGRAPQYLDLKGIFSNLILVEGQ